MAESLKDKTAKGLLWGGLSNGITQLLSTLFGIIMLRLLTPDDYGKIAVLLIYSSIASSLQDSGFTAALINKKEPTHEEYNSVFWFNIIVSAAAYIILWFAAPLIAWFNNEPVLIPLARFHFIGFFIASLGIVQRAYLLGHLMVKQQSIINVVGLTTSNIVGLILALHGYAFWALSIQAIVYVSVIHLSNWYVSPWRPTLHIDLRPALKMMGFSSKILFTSLFNQLNTHVFAFLLGRLYGTRTVGIYSNARKWNDMACYTINGMLNGVSQPVLAKVRDEQDRYRNVFRKMLRFTCFVSFPCMFGLGIVSREFILITVGDKWAESADLMPLICIYGAFYPLHTLYNNMTISLGKSGVSMLCTISLCICVWLGLIGMKSLGLYSMIVFFVAINIVWVAVWHWFARKLFRMSYLQAGKDIIPFLALTCAVMAVTCYATSGIDNMYISIISKIIIAAVLYVGVMYLLKAKILIESIDYIFKRKGNKG